MCAPMQAGDDGEDDGETPGKDFLELHQLIQLTRRHVREISRLEGLREVEVEVTETTRQELVLLPPGIRVRAPALCEDGELLWSPPGARAEAKVVESTGSVVTRQLLPLEMPVEGVFVRQWGERGDGPGQFQCPFGVAVWGQEVLVCDSVDPNMTFVVPMAAAVVERRGGMLIHGAIIAREYGLPCVTGVPRATTLISNGDPLTVDGYLGIVTLMGR